MLFRVAVIGGGCELGTASLLMKPSKWDIIYFRRDSDSEPLRAEVEQVVQYPTAIPVIRVRDYRECTVDEYHGNLY